MAIETILGYTIDDESMKSSTCGMIGVAKKEGKKYFCKKFNYPVQPFDNGALSESIIIKNRKTFSDFVRKKLRLNNKLREISYLGGNIVFPIEELVHDNHWFEFSEFIDGAIREKDYSTVIARMKAAEKLLLLKTAIAALYTIHEHGIVHADLKLANIMIVHNAKRNYVAKIIDFDGAFFEDSVPKDSITGTADYYSPELALYSSSEDPDVRANISRNISTKTDVFTMGLVFHEILAGKKPEGDQLTSTLIKIKANNKFLYPWQILLANDKGEEKTQLVISDQVANPVYVALISDMLCLEPDWRPTAKEVLQRLIDMSLPIETDVWLEDDICIKEEAVRKSVIGLRKREFTRNGTVVREYEIIEKDGRRYLKNCNELIQMGFATNINNEEAEIVNLAQDNELWPEDSGKYSVDLDYLRKQKMTFKGKTEMKGRRGYLFQMDNSDSEIFLDSQRCKMMKFFIQNM